MAISNLRQKRHLHNKQAILEAARQIIAQKGLAGLSMRELAEAIGYSHAALYEYFAGKDQIIETLCQDSWERLVNHLGSVSPGLPPSQQLLEMARAYLDFARKYPDEYLLMFATRQEHSQSFEDIAANSTFTALLKTVQAGIEAGEFKPGPEGSGEKLAYRCWVTVHGLAMLLVTHFHHNESEISELNLEVLKAVIDELRSS